MRAALPGNEELWMLSANTEAGTRKLRPRHRKALGLSESIQCIHIV